MITYALVLFLVLGGHVQTFVMDHGLTMEDCATELADNGNAPQLRCMVETHA